MRNDEPAREPVKEDARIDALEARLAAAQQREEERNRPQASGAHVQGVYASGFGCCCKAYTFACCAPGRSSRVATAALKIITNNGHAGMHLTGNLYPVRVTIETAFPQRHA